MNELTEKALKRVLKWFLCVVWTAPKIETISDNGDSVELVFFFHDHLELYYYFHAFYQEFAIDSIVFVSDKTGLYIVDTETGEMNKILTYILHPVNCFPNEQIDEDFRSSIAGYTWEEYCAIETAEQYYLRKGEKKQ